MKTVKFTLSMIILLAFAYFNEVAGQWGTNGTNIYNTNAGNVGIGNSLPTTLLHVQKNMTEPTITVQNLGGSGGATYTMIDQLSGANWKFKATNNGGFKIRDHANLLDVFVIEPNSAANSIYINADGKVGIGTSTVNSKLHVYYSLGNYTLLGHSDKYLNYIYHQEDPTNGDGQTGLFAMRFPTSANAGTGYDINTSNSAITGSSWNGNYYSFGSIGFNYNEYNRCGGVLGAQENGGYWGSLGYKSSGSITYGGYFTSTGSGSGKSDPGTNLGIGIGAWGDLFGADIHGKIYGAYIEGEHYASFSHGNVYKDGLDVHLQEKANGSNAVMFTLVSTDAAIQTCGTATLSAGKASISFDPAFASVVSSAEPIIVTVTPVGESNGVYLSKVSAAGFSVAENNAGKSNVVVNYIAIGKRAGYEKPGLAEEVIEAGYTDKLSRGLHSDADLETDGEGLYYENGQLVVGIHPSTLPDPNRIRVAPELDKAASPE